MVNALLGGGGGGGDGPFVVLPTGLVHETPFETARETCTTTTSKTRVFDSLDDPRVALSEDILCPVPISARLESVCVGGL